jgi:hypothetical protein
MILPAEAVIFFDPLHLKIHTLKSFMEMSSFLFIIDQYGN